MTKRRHRYDYLLSALPGLEALGSVPPMTKQELLERVSDANGPDRTVEVLLLMDDLIQREALLAGEIDPDQADLAILKVNPADNEPALPEALMPEENAEQDNPRMLVDALWDRYFRWAARVAKRTGSAFLKGWIGFEVGLRNALAQARAQTLELDATGYLVAQDLADRDLDFGQAVAAWSSASDPMAAQDALDKARWAWIEEHGRWYSFKADEIEAYAARLVLLHRWRRLQSERPAAASVGAQ